MERRQSPHSAGGGTKSSSQWDGGGALTIRENNLEEKLQITGRSEVDGAQ